MGLQNQLCLVSITIFLLVFSLLPLSTFEAKPTEVSKPSKLVENLCNADKIDRKFCVEALSNSSPAAAAKDVKQLTKAVMDLAASDAQSTLDVISAMAKKPGSPEALQALQTCLDAYKYAIGAFGMVFDEMREDPLSANYDVMLIAPEADKCQNATVSANVQEPRISAGIQHLHAYVSMGDELTVQARRLESNS